MRFEIIHCHGSGNDFPLIDARALSLRDEQWAGVARALADRAGPVGGDGLLLLTNGDDSHAFGMRMFNSDGSEAETCLNGLRCVARAGFEALGIDRARVRLKTSSVDAVRDVEIAPGVWTVRETAGPATLTVATWPMDAGAGRIVDAPVPPLDGERRFTAVAIPNPHLVSFVDRVDEAELVRLGEVCEAAPSWLPNRANVSFVEVRGPETIFVRTFERGVGLTNSCGSAMAASTYAAGLTGRVAWDADITVLNAGGLVRARAGEDAIVSLSGNATWEWGGSVEVDADAGRASDLVVTRRYADEVAAWAKVAG
ncbi:diaminopimelate epimerase [Sphingomonas aerophila]|uniref:Diaminopimelate epimerase n=1 Tax=Sphingomonas aerophila TaxID=1344948 RepID=A0A7W9ESN9_9SPHN|nr:diaminopimelate epimerase [Sphingomonas aerophila]MBB5713331.1 diaminopimelate epimerase [Sphingomonas aerophila]